MTNRAFHNQHKQSEPKPNKESIFFKPTYTSTLYCEGPPLRNKEPELQRTTDRYNYNK